MLRKTFSHMGAMHFWHHGLFRPCHSPLSIQILPLEHSWDLVADLRSKMDKMALP